MIAVGSGTAVIAGGNGADAISFAGGTAVVLGDTGVVQFDAQGRAILAESTADGATGSDTITAGDGDIWVIAGDGNDNVITGDGRKVILGDHGRITAFAGALVSVETTEPQAGGDDVITVGNGDAVIFGGSGADQITAGDGNHVLSGDMGMLAYRDGIRAQFDVVIGPLLSGGDDTITAGTGASWIAGGEGADLIRNGGGETVIFGDAGFIRADAAGRVLLAEATQPTLGGNDTIYGGSDRDIIFGGAGDDYLNGGAGDDMLAGDFGRLTRETRADGSTLYTFEQDQYFVYGGNDVLIGGPGRDLMIGGTGHDIFDVDYSDDFALGEFGRFRLLAGPDGNERLVSLLTLAPDDLDLIGNTGTRLFYGRGQIVDGLLQNWVWPTLSEQMRVDLLYLADDLLSVARLFGILTESDQSFVQEFRFLTEPALLTSGNLVYDPAVAAEDEDGETPEDHAALNGDAGQSGGGWTLSGWTMQG